MREIFESAREIGTAEGRLDYWYENVWAEDIDYRSIEGAIDDVGPIRGRDAMRTYVEDWFDTVEGFEISVQEEIEVGGGTVMAVLRIDGTVRGSGRVTQQLPVVWTFRDGKLVRGREYLTRQEALRAAGLDASGQ
jgi:ketosteroid isomerase-like protein